MWFSWESSGCRELRLVSSRRQGASCLLQITQKPPRDDQERFIRTLMEWPWLQQIEIPLLFLLFNIYTLVDLYICTSVCFACLHIKSPTVLIITISPYALCLIKIQRGRDERENFIGKNVKTVFFYKPYCLIPEIALRAGLESLLAECENVLLTLCWINKHLKRQVLRK